MPGRRPSFGSGFDSTFGNRSISRALGLTPEEEDTDYRRPSLTKKAFLEEQNPYPSRVARRRNSIGGSSIQTATIVMPPMLAPT